MHDGAEIDCGLRIRTAAKLGSQPADSELVRIVLCVVFQIRTAAKNWKASQRLAQWRYAVASHRFRLRAAALSFCKLAAIAMLNFASDAAKDKLTI